MVLLAIAQPLVYGANMPEKLEGVKYIIPFYYAGHGVQIRGSNYLVPIAANPAREANVYLQMVDIAVVRARWKAREQSSTS
jgi:hypothetical protein